MTTKCMCVFVFGVCASVCVFVHEQEATKTSAFVCLDVCVLFVSSISQDLSQHIYLSPSLHLTIHVSINDMTPNVCFMCQSRQRVDSPAGL